MDGNMLGTELLNLRRNRTSTVATLLGGIDHVAAAPSDLTRMTRAFALKDLGDAVLANVAVHALEAYWGDMPVAKSHRAAHPSRRRRLHADPGQVHQRRLFAY